MNRVTLITLSANDVRELAGFYKSLGWVASHELEETVFFDMAGQKLGIYNRAMLARDMGRTPEELGTGAVTLAQNFADKAAVDAAYDVAIAARGHRAEAARGRVLGRLQRHMGRPRRARLGICLEPVLGARRRRAAGMSVTIGQLACMRQR